MSELINHLYNRHHETVDYVDDEAVLESLHETTLEQFIDYCDASIVEIDRLRSLARIALEIKQQNNG
jgi:hypothetical protein